MEYWHYKGEVWKYNAKCKKSVPSPPKKRTYAMIPFIWNAQNQQIYRDRMEIRVARAGRQGAGEQTLKGTLGP